MILLEEMEPGDIEYAHAKDVESTQCHNKE